MKKNEIDMLNGDLLKGILLFSVPLIITNLLQLLFNAADVVIVGKYAGDLYLAAVSSSSPLIHLATNLFNGLTIGVNVLIARFIGENKREEISKALHSSLMFGTAIGILLMFIGLAFARAALEWMDSPANVIDLSTTYVKIYFLGMPAFLIYNYGAACLRAKGDTKRPLYYLSLSGLVNVILNYILVVFFHKNVEGVAIATVVSQYLSAVLIIGLLVNETDEFHFALDKLKMDWPILLEVIKYGIPVGIQNSMFSISNTVLQSYINVFGSTVMAASGASSSFESFPNGIVQGLTVSAMTFVSQNAGAKKYKRIMKTIAISFVLGAIYCVLFALYATYLGRPILGLYTNDPACVEIALQRAKLVMYTYAIFTFMQLLVSVLRGLGYSFGPTMLYVAGVCGVRLVFLWFFYPKNPTFMNVMNAYPISWIITGMALLVVLVVTLRKDRHYLSVND